MYTLDDNNPILIRKHLKTENNGHVTKYNIIKPTHNGFECMSKIWFDKIKDFDSLWEEGQVLVIVNYEGDEFGRKQNIFKSDGTFVIQKPIEEWPNSIKLNGLRRGIAWYGYDSYWLDIDTGEMKEI